MTFPDLELEAETNLDKLKRRLRRKAVILQGKRPSTLKAGMLYILAKERGLTIGLEKVAEAYGCTSIAVRKNAKLLKQLMQNPARK